jgi:hypothetical protein
MISERKFARSFTGFWMELLPLLTPKFVHIINDAFKIHLTDENGEPLRPIQKNSKIRDLAVIAEFAFYISQLSIQEGQKVAEIINNDKYFDKAQRDAYEVVKRYEGGTVNLNLPLISEEIEEGLALALNYERFFEINCKNKEIEFGPIISGAGFISECKADISVGNTLFEVKTVDRNVAGKDIRQLVLYLALQGITGNRKWTHAGFFNPRRAVYHEFRVDDVIRQMSGGKASLEIFQELIDFVSSRDIQIDAVF